MSFYALIVHFFFGLLYSIVWVYSILVLKDISVDSNYNYSHASFCVDMFLNSLGICSKVPLPDCIVQVCLASKWSSGVVVTFWVLSHDEWELLLFHILSSILCCQCSWLWHSNKYGEESNYIICISLITSSAGYLFICLFAMCISSLERCLLKSLDHLKKLGCLFSDCWILRILPIFWITIFCQMCLLKIFSLGLWLISSFSWFFFHRIDFCFKIIYLFGYTKSQL